MDGGGKAQTRGASKQAGCARRRGLRAQQGFIRLRISWRRGAGYSIPRLRNERGLGEFKAMVAWRGRTSATQEGQNLRKFWQEGGLSFHRLHPANSGDVLGQQEAVEATSGFGDQVGHPRPLLVSSVT